MEISTYSHRIVERITNNIHEAPRAGPGTQEALSNCSLFPLRKTKFGNSLQTAISTATLDFTWHLHIFITVSVSLVRQNITTFRQGSSSYRAIPQVDSLSVLKIYTLLKLTRYEREWDQVLKHTENINLYLKNTEPNAFNLMVKSTALKLFIRNVLLRGEVMVWGNHSHQNFFLVKTIHVWAFGAIRDEQSSYLEHTFTMAFSIDIL